VIKIYTLEQYDLWITVVKKFKNCDIYYLPEYVAAYKKNGDGDPILIHYEYNDVEVINVVIKRDITSIERFSETFEKNLYFDFITPYGYGGILFKKAYNKKQRIEFIKNYVQFFKQRNIVSEFIRFNPLLENYKKLEGIIDVTSIGPTVYINTENIDRAWNNYSPKNRNIIRKSIKNGIKVYWGVNRELLQEFIRLYFETMDRDHASEYYYFSNDYFESLLEDLKYKILFFYAEYNPFT